ncbi:unnamed protein product [Strongylus vulgaris]|uniref:Uncharacterized protein n=1 Tax=Strongylus vulgaris TaxID=40348 RepID=A0A3P7J066_STRVU|nr:unnamed protein product [Strongylus vulgaris]
MRRLFVEWLPYILMMRTPDHPRAPKPKVIGKSVLPIHRLSTLPILNLPRHSEVNAAIRSSSKIQKEKPLPYLKYFYQFCDDLKAINEDLEKMTAVIKETYEHEMVISEKPLPYLKYFYQFCDDLKAINEDLEKMTAVIKETYEHEMVRFFLSTRNQLYKKCSRFL